MRGALNAVFATVILAVAFYVLWRSGVALGPFDQAAKSA
jgi:hypothetical protein